MIRELIEGARQDLAKDLQGEENHKVLEAYYVEGMRKAFMLMFEQSLYTKFNIDIVE